MLVILLSAIALGHPNQALAELPDSAKDTRQPPKPYEGQRSTVKHRRTQILFRSLGISQKRHIPVHHMAVQKAQENHRQGR